VKEEKGRKGRREGERGMGEKQVREEEGRKGRERRDSPCQS